MSTFVRYNLPSAGRVDIPLLTQLIPGGIKPATIFGVEFDPESQWFAVAATIAAKTLLENRSVGYLAMARSRNNVLDALSALEINVSATLKEGRLEVQDWYSATLTGGRVRTEGGHEGLFEQIDGGVRVRSLKVSDLSLEWLKWTKLSPEVYERDTVGQTHMAGWSLLLVESCSSQMRFNDEKAYVEWMESRVNPNERRANRITLQGFVRGVHPEWVYRRMEADWDGVIDIRVMEKEEKAQNFLRIRSLRGQPHDSAWHQIEIKPNGEATLAT